jgi:hypothetical protein
MTEVVRMMFGQMWSGTVRPHPQARRAPQLQKVLLRQVRQLVVEQFCPQHEQRP